MLTVHVLWAMLIAAGVIMALAQVDRVISSASGTIITTVPPLVFQALDLSVIRSIDVREGAAGREGAIAGDAGSHLR